MYYNYLTLLWAKLINFINRYPKNINYCGLIKFQYDSVPTSTRLIHSGTYSLQKTNTEEESHKEIIDASKDRSKVVPVEVSIRYLLSSGKLILTNMATVGY